MLPHTNSLFQFKKWHAQLKPLERIALIFDTSQHISLEVNQPNLQEAFKDILDILDKGKYDSRINRILDSDYENWNNSTGIKRPENKQQDHKHPRKQAKKIKRNKKIMALLTDSNLFVTHSQIASLQERSNYEKQFWKRLKLALDKSTVKSVKYYKPSLNYK